MEDKNTVSKAVVPSGASLNSRATLKSYGTVGLHKYGGYVYEEFLPELRWPRAGKVYQEMADNDPVIGAIMYLAEMLIRGTSWSVEAADESEVAKEQAEFVKSCMDDMEASWHETISEIISVLTYGFSFHEILYKVRRGPYENNPRYKSKYSDGKIGWRGFPIRSQSSLHAWTFDKNGEVSGFEQLTNDPYKHVVIPMSKGLLFRTRVSRGNPEGKSLLRNAYRPWFFKKHFEEIEGIGIERDLAGFPVLQTPEGVDIWNDDNPQMVATRQAAEAIVASIRRDSEEGLLLPYGWDLKLLTSTSTRQINIGETIDRYDNRIAITMLSDLILLGNKSGSFALADTKQSMLAAALQSQLLNIADVINTKAVTNLMKFNNMNMELAPSIKPGVINTPTVKEVALLIRAMGLNIAGDKRTLDTLRTMLGLPDLTDKEFEEIYSIQSEQANREWEASQALDDTTEDITETTNTTNGDEYKDAVDRTFEQNDLVNGGEDNLD